MRVTRRYNYYKVLPANTRVFEPVLPLQLREIKISDLLPHGFDDLLQILLLALQHLKVPPYRILSSLPDKLKDECLRLQERFREIEQEGIEHKLPEVITFFTSGDFPWL